MTQPIQPLHDPICHAQGPEADAAGFALEPARLLIRPGEDRYHQASRLWQGIPSMERTDKGTLYAAFYTGMKTEGCGNFIVLTRSDTDGLAWEDALVVVEHPNAQVRCFDPCLWVDPRGRLWFTWTQSRQYYDGRQGVWAVVSGNPDDPLPSWSEPRRIANGLMMNKPLVTSAGDWLFPCAIWSHAFEKPFECHPELAGEVFSNVYVSRDEGISFALQGGADVPDRAFDEHMAVELKDGRLWMLVRTMYGIGESFSMDGGQTWSPGQPSGISGPNSRFFIRRLASGRLLLVNHFNARYPQGRERGFKPRSSLMAQLSEDDGQTWIGGLMLDARNEVSYPDGKQAPDGRIYIVYDFERYKAREILMAVFREEDVLEGRLASGDARLRVLVSKAAGTAAP